MGLGLMALDAGAGSGLLGLAAGGRGERRGGTLRLVRHLIGHLDLGRRRAEAQKAGLGVLQHFHGNAVPIHFQFAKRRLKARVDGFAGGGNEFFPWSDSFIRLRPQPGRRPCGSGRACRRGHGSRDARGCRRGTSHSGRPSRPPGRFRPSWRRTPAGGGPRAPRAPCAPAFSCWCFQ